MEHLTAQDTRRMMAFLQALYAIRTQEELRPYLIATIPTIISTDASSYNEVNSKIGYAFYQGWPPDHPDIPDSYEILGQYSHQSPLITQAEQSPSVMAAKTTDFVSHRTFKTSDLFNEFYRPLQLHYNMGVRLTRGPGPLIAMGLLRTHRDFTSHDVELLQVLSPHLLQAYHNAAVVTRMQEQRSASSKALETTRQAIISITTEGKIRFSTPFAEQLLLRYCGDRTRDRGCLPGTLRNWQRHEHARQCSESLVHAPSRPLHIDGTTGVLTVRLLRQDRQTLLLLEETLAQEKRPAFSALGLSPRETEILSWVTQGKTNPEISLILGISSRTVQKHLERIYGRLGVENRHAAIVLALTASRMARTSDGSD